MNDISVIGWENPQSCDDAPFAATVDKTHEAMYFYYKMLETYHEPYEFRYNLNAFIQALRNITFMLQAEEAKPAGFDTWYAKAQARMKADKNLKKFIDLRNLIVKQGMLVGKSRAYIGIYRGRTLKFAMGHDVDPFADNKHLLSMGVKEWTSPEGLLDEGHSAIGEQIGVERLWVVDELGDEDVTNYCREAFEHVQCVVRQAVGIAGGYLGSHSFHDSSQVRVLLEADVDPTLPKTWGWEN